MASTNRSKLRRFVFTLNNWTREDIQELKSLVPDNISYLCYGKEVGKKTGTKHLQGYGELKKQLHFTTLKKMMGNKYYLAKSKGTQQEAIEYCAKEGKFYEFGEKKNMGARGDLDEVREDAHDNGMRVVVQYANIQQIKVAEKYLMYCEPKRNWKSKIIWIVGPSGSGKTRKAHELCEGMATFESTPPLGKDGKVWFDGYDGHEAMILNEANPKWLGFEFLKTLLDRYACALPVKGTMRQCRAKLIILTSVKSPYDMYEDEFSELGRRIDSIIEMASEVEGNIKTSTFTSKDFVYEED